MPEQSRERASGLKHIKNKPVRPKHPHIVLIPNKFLSTGTKENTVTAKSVVKENSGILTGQFTREPGPRV